MDIHSNRRLINMANYIKISMEGHKEIEKVLEMLPQALNERIMKSANKRGVQPLIERAAANAPLGPGGKKGPSGNLKASIGISPKIKGANIPKKLKKGITIVGPRRGKKSGEKGWHAHFVEYGVAPRIVKKSKKVDIRLAKG